MHTVYRSLSSLSEYRILTALFLSLLSIQLFPPVKWATDMLIMDSALYYINPFFRYLCEHFPSFAVTSPQQCIVG